MGSQNFLLLVFIHMISVCDFFARFQMTVK